MNHHLIQKKHLADNSIRKLSFFSLYQNFETQKVPKSAKNIDSSPFLNSCFSINKIGLNSLSCSQLDTLRLQVKLELENILDSPFRILLAQIFSHYAFIAESSRASVIFPVKRNVISSREISVNHSTHAKEYSLKKVTIVILASKSLSETSIEANNLVRHNIENIFSPGTEACFFPKWSQSKVLLLLSVSRMIQPYIWSFHQHQNSLKYPKSADSFWSSIFLFSVTAY